MKTKLLPIKTVYVATPAYILAIVLLLAGLSSAQDCLILKRMGPADEITSHLYSFGIRGKQFQYVEGNLPQGISFHGRLTDHDARKILDKGGKIQILEPKYTPTDLDATRRQCSGLPPVATEVSKDAPKQDEKAPTSGTASIPEDR